MSPATIIKQSRADGVRLVLSTTGTIKVIGDSAPVNRWLAAIRGHKAEIIVVLRAKSADDRRLCTDCLNLADGVCRVAVPGGLVSAMRGYHPVALPVRCEGYAPGPDDEDRRHGRERWPWLDEFSGKPGHRTAVRGSRHEPA